MMDDLISRKALLEVIAERNRNSCNGSMSCLQMKRMVEKLPAIKADHLIANSVTVGKDTNVPRWIPVTERLPTREDADKEGAVLAIQKNSKCAVKWDYETVALFPKDFRYWMSVPELPKDGDT